MLRNLAFSLGIGGEPQKDLEQDLEPPVWWGLA